MLINIDNEKYEYFHDMEGNIFLLFNFKYYLITIDNNDNMELLEIENIDIFNDTTGIQKYGNIKNTNDKNTNTLRKKIIDELDKEKENDDLLSDEDEYDDEYKTKYTYLPEEKLYFTEHSDDEIDEYYEQNCKIYKFGNDAIMKCLNKTLDSPSNYDTLVIDKNTNIVLFKIESIYGNSYRILLYRTGEIELNIIGSKKKLFKINIDNSDPNKKTLIVL